jgi:hypothetical protein
MAFYDMYNIIHLFYGIQIALVAITGDVSVVKIAQMQEQQWMALIHFFEGKALCTCYTINHTRQKLLHKYLSIKLKKIY